MILLPPLREKANGWKKRWWRLTPRSWTSLTNLDWPLSSIGKPPEVSNSKLKASVTKIENDYCYNSLWKLYILCFTYPRENSIIWLRRHRKFPVSWLSRPLRTMPTTVRPHVLAVGLRTSETWQNIKNFGKRRLLRHNKHFDPSKSSPVF